LEVVSANERRHTEDDEMGVQDLVNCTLGSIPRTVSFKNKTFFLRGVVGFTPPIRDSDDGHYRGYCVRTDFSWEMYDDVRDKATIIDSSVGINVHIILYTI